MADAQTAQLPHPTVLCKAEGLNHQILLVLRQRVSDCMTAFHTYTKSTIGNAGVEALFG